MDGESQEPGQGAWPELRDDRPLRVAMEALKVMEAFETYTRSSLQGAQDRQPVVFVWSAFQAERLGSPGEAGEGRGGRPISRRAQDRPSQGKILPLNRACWRTWSRARTRAGCSAAIRGTLLAVGSLSRQASGSGSAIAVAQPSQRSNRSTVVERSGRPGIWRPPPQDNT